ncbi:hypothetical protein BUZ08_00815 [Staphylococcus gallinarum]|uniref:hypothetical protein n=1 Tax=Staphylococcus gallinarum TaxID=1293 RepID=UPI000D1EF252|nr:hypothetical protein [Staphylococcus gallinarum]PTL18484.1 hypothetical protein BUZ08_00815 [Staphylococcus gallinarum]RIO80059.1 hypothetical protein BUZ07_03995 [Staphylococcus gallinarum]
MKIKTKKQLNLPQLIEYAWENGIKGETFYARETRMENVHFNTSGRAEFSSVHQFSSDDYFTVEVADEITEDTVLPKLIERWKHDDKGDEASRYVGHDDKSINRVLFANPESVEVTHFYIENDDRELVLIWRDGKLVE